MKPPKKEIQLANLLAENRRNDLIERKIKHNIILAANSYELCRTFKCVDCNALEEKNLLVL